MAMLLMADGAAVRACCGDGRALVSLLTWLSPAFPVGAFAFSHGLETAISEGRVTCGETLHAWVSTLLAEGSGRTDLLLFVEAFHAAVAEDAARLAAVVELGVALGGSKERREETVALGTAFSAAASPWAAPDALLPQAAPYPVVVAALAARHPIALDAALPAFAQAFAATLVSVATRLVPLGQREAVKVLHRLETAVLDAARNAATSSLDDLGSAAFLSEIAAMRHETLATRIFRS